jgi:hypothetical protein
MRKTRILLKNPDFRFLELTVAGAWFGAVFIG